MEFKNLEYKLSSIESKFKQDLINMLVSKGHKGKGKLVDSIKINFIKNAQGYSIEINALEYIKYLDHGNLLEQFIIEKTNELKQIISDEASKDLMIGLKKQLNIS